MLILDKKQKLHANILLTVVLIAGLSVAALGISGVAGKFMLGQPLQISLSSTWTNDFANGFNGWSYTSGATRTIQSPIVYPGTNYAMFTSDTAYSVAIADVGSTYSIVYAEAALYISSMPTPRQFTLRFRPSGYWTW